MTSRPVDRFYKHRALKGDRADTTTLLLPVVFSTLQDLSIHSITSICASSIPICVDSAHIHIRTWRIRARGSNLRRCHNPQCHQSGWIKLIQLWTGEVMRNSERDIAYI